MTAHLQHQPLTSAPATPRRSRGARIRRACLRLIGGVLALLLAAFTLGWVLTPGVADADRRVAARLAAFGGTPSTGEAPERIAAALLATEDSRFGSHPGIDWRGALRAPLGVVVGRDLGGSTIQQQLARVLYEDGATDTGARARSVVLAVKLDRGWSDEQLLRMYLDAVYFGHGFYGVQAAAEGYFGLAPAELDWAQATVLAGLVQAPSAYDPLAHPDLAAARQAHVLDRLVAVGSITRADADAIAAQPWHLTAG